MTIVPTTNWRIVRPREIRARNSPTNEAQAIHQAQKNRVHSDIHSVAWSKAKVSIVMPGNERDEVADVHHDALEEERRSLPVTSTRTRARPRARITLSWERNRMPLSTPVVAEIAAIVTASDGQRDLGAGADRDAEQDVEPDVEEHHPDAEAGGDPEDGPEHGGGVDGVAQRAVDTRLPKIG